MNWQNTWSMIHLPRNTILVGDVRAQLATLPDESVHCVVTSPPYWGLRDYGAPGQLGLEPTPEEYVANMVAVFREVRRVLRSDGTLWLNLGDSFQDKQLQGIPWRVAFALQADGWWLRSDIIWSKPNPMPESVTDRPTKAHEYVFLLSKSQTYYYDHEAIREPAQYGRRDWSNVEAVLASATMAGDTRIDHGVRAKASVTGGDPSSGRNKRTVWEVATQPYAEAHFATYPEALVKPCILAGTSEHGVCSVCGAPWQRVVERSRATFTRGDDPSLLTGRAGMNRKREGDADRYVLAVPQHELAAALASAAQGREDEMRLAFGSKWDHWTRTDASGARVPTFADAAEIEQRLGVVVPFDGQPGGWQPTCKHEAPLAQAVVLDPFFGSGTTGFVAKRAGRAYVGIELNPTYAAMAEKRIGSQGMLL